MNNKELVKLLAKDSIQKAIRHYGIELTEEKIHHIYNCMPYLKWYILREYYNVTNRSEQYKQMEK